jgi:hypothetical protein
MNEGAQPQQPQKKGMSPLAWIAIGCAGLIVLAGIVVVAGGFFAVKKGKEFVEKMEDNPTKSIAEMAIKMNPDTKFIESDDETVTFETKDGEIVTMNFEDIQNGNFSMTNEEGETSNLSFGPSGITGTATDENGETTNFNIFGGGGDTSNVPKVLLYPGADNISPTIASRSEGEYTGMLNYSTDATMDEVVEWQTNALEDCTVSRTDVMGTRTAQLECGGSDTVALTFMGQDGSLNVMVNYKIADDE